MLLKGCARCGGDLFDEEELGQVDMVCLQCGRRVSALIISRWSLSPAPASETAGKLALPAAGGRS